MADPRGFPQGGQQGQFGMMARPGNFNAMQQQQQQYAMMQQQQAMMMQQRAAFSQQPPQQPQPGMFPRQAPPPQLNMASPGGAWFGAYVQPGTQMAPPYGGQNFRPPSYTPQMAQEFKAKQERLAAQQARQMDGQRKRMEQAMREQKFKEQQKKLKEFKAIGVRKIDADSLINSIMGTPNVRPAAPATFGMAAARAPGPHGPPPPHTVTVTESPEEDNFGDFMSGPSVPASDQPQSETQATCTQAPQQPQEPEQMQQTPAADSTSQAAAAAAAQKKDLMSMMMECSDLTAPKEAKSFVKKTAVKDAPKNVRKATYQASQKARRWDGETEKLSELFVVEQPSPPPSAGADPGVVQLEPGAVPPTSQPAPPQELPKWCQGEAPVPELYHHVLQASVKDNQIDTSLVYPILVRSGLPREILGHIWALANKKVPGQLHPEELWVVLALIACAQHNINIMTLDILYKLPQPPIPFLGQTQNAGQVAPPASAPGPGPVASVQVTDSGVTPIMATGSSLGTAASPNEEEFDDFQEAPMSSSASFGSFTVASPPSIVSPESVPTTSGPVDLISGDDKYLEIRVAGENMKESPQGFTDFKSSTEKSSIGFADFAATLPNAPMTSKTHSEPTFGNISSAKPADSRSDIANLEADDFDDFKTGENDEFADFQSAGSSLSGSANQDKLAALKALVQSKELYTPKTKEEDIPKETDGKPGTETWADFKGKEIVTGDDKYSAFRQLPVDEGPTQPDLFDVTTPPSGEGEPWADFASAEPKSHIPSDDDWFAQSKERKLDWAQDAGSDGFKKSESQSSFTAFESAELPPSAEASKLKGTSSSKVQASVSKGINYFARNLDVGGVSAGTGMSPLDITPPELPDIKDEEDEDSSGFDKFGTFQSSAEVAAARPGLSSLVTPYGGFDDIGEPTSRFGSGNPDMFSYNSQPRQKSADRDSADTISNSSSEFTGWKSQSKATREDTQSVSSLDLNTARPQRGSKDGSPAGGDSQSVSSLEFGATDSGRKSGSPQDEQSVASLELKVASTEAFEVSPEDAGQDARNDDNFGEFSSAIEHNPAYSSELETAGSVDVLPPKPRDASELLQTGNMPSFGDRYSGLIQQPQDSDRHRYDWQRCLEKCREMIQDANNTFNSISSPSVCDEVIGSERGTEYLQGIVEIYRVACRLQISMKAVSVSSTRLSDLLRDIELAWTNLSAFLGSSSVLPKKEACDFSPGILKVEDDNAQQRACGLCLIDVSSRSKAPEADVDTHKLMYGGRSYHSTCANFWVNCVDSTLPTLTIPELL